MTASQWNAQHPIGTAVRVDRGSKNYVYTRTTSQAWEMGGGLDVVKLDGFEGCYALHAVEAVKE